MATARVNIVPDVISAAVKYSRRESEIRKKFGAKLDAWLSGRDLPTTKQLDEFATEARVPSVYLYGSEFPDLSPDVPEMRTIGDKPVAEPSPDLNDTVAACEMRQDWYVDYARAHELQELEYVGSASISDDVEAVARSMKETLRWRQEGPATRSPRGYLDVVGRLADEAGILVMTSSHVPGHHGRRLDPVEFRGFTLVHPLAPLVFVNSNDWDSAQLFTLAHELAHVWLGRAGISAPDHWHDPKIDVEKWCNAVAAELLVPRVEMETALGLTGSNNAIDQIPDLARHFKVSQTVMYRRLRDLGLLPQAEFRKRYRRDLTKSRELYARRNARRTRNVDASAATRKNQRGRAPNVYCRMSDTAGIGNRFIRAVLADTKAGETLYTEAYRLLGIRNAGDLDALDESLSENTRLAA